MSLFSNEGWSGLMDEIDMEVKRISKRNLGRDDRFVFFNFYSFMRTASKGHCQLSVERYFGIVSY